jgi:hypothetical protein
MTQHGRAILADAIMTAVMASNNFICNGLRMRQRLLK